MTTSRLQGRERESEREGDMYIKKAHLHNNTGDFKTLRRNDNNLHRAQFEKKIDDNNQNQINEMLKKSLIINIDNAQSR